jgi:hypothetical protein
LPVATQRLVTRSLPESEGEGDGDGDHEARHPEKSGDRCALATGELGGPGTVSCNRGRPLRSQLRGCLRQRGGRFSQLLTDHAPAGIVAGGTLSARTGGGFWLRGEEPVGYPNLRPATCSWSQVAGSPG